MSKCWPSSPKPLARHCCLQPEKVFTWAKKHSNYRDLRRVSSRLIENAAGMELLTAVLNDQPLEK